MEKTDLCCAPVRYLVPSAMQLKKKTFRDLAELTYNMTNATTRQLSVYLSVCPLVNWFQMETSQLVSIYMSLYWIALPNAHLIDPKPSI